MGRKVASSREVPCTPPRTPPPESQGAPLSIQALMCAGWAGQAEAGVPTHQPTGTREREPRVSSPCTAAPCTAATAEGLSRTPSLGPRLHRTRVCTWPCGLSAHLRSGQLPLWASMSLSRKQGTDGSHTPRGFSSLMLVHWWAPERS